MSGSTADAGTNARTNSGANASADGRSSPGRVTDGVTVDRRPARVAGCVAAVAALLSVWAVAGGPDQTTAVGIAGVGLLLLGGAAVARDRDEGLVALLVGSVGFVGVLAGVGAAVALPATTTLRAEAPLGLLGTGLLALGLVPARAGWSRRLVSVGAALLVCNVVLSGLVHGADALHLLAGFTASVVAWDVAEHAINVGEQLGAGARTWPIELGHAGATTGFGAVAVGAALWIRGFDVTGVPLTGLLLLVGAAIVLLAALYN